MPLVMRIESIEYARTELERLGYDENFIVKVEECIRATEPKYVSNMPEASIVRECGMHTPTLFPCISLQKRISIKIYIISSIGSKNISINIFENDYSRIAE